jgi:membrane associated rhomboid family serine protease
VGGSEQAVAWEAHLGGFLTGLLLFSLFDPARTQLPPQHSEI